MSVTKLPTFVRIMSNKTVFKKTSEGSRSRFIEYTNSLSEIAKHQKGFIESQSYWNYPLNNSDYNKCYEIVTISDWKSIDDWNEWYDSNSRKKIHDRYKEIIHEEDFRVLLTKHVNDDLFLL